MLLNHTNKIWKNLLDNESLRCWILPITKTKISQINHSNELNFYCKINNNINNLITKHSIYVFFVMITLLSFYFIINFMSNLLCFQNSFTFCFDNALLCLCFNVVFSSANFFYFWKIFLWEYFDLKCLRKFMVYILFIEDNGGVLWILVLNYCFFCCNF